MESQDKENSINAQTDEDALEEVQINERGEKVKVIAYYSPGIIKMESNYKDGALHGITNGYYENGAVEYVSNFSHGKLEGKTVCFDINGVKTQEMYFVNGLLSGVFTCYQNESVQCQISYLNGKKNGEMIFYSENGNIKQISLYENDLLNGDSSTYDENSSEIIQKLHYFKGKKQGKCYIYYPNSDEKIYEEAQYENDLLEGFLKRYHLNGAIRELREFKKGKANGSPVFFNEEGIPLEQLEKKQGIFDKLFNHKL